MLSLSEVSLRLIEYKRPLEYTDGGIQLITEIEHDNKTYRISEVRSDRLQETMVFVIKDETVDWYNVGGLIFNDTDEAMRWILET
jgi:hypothetical protein